MKLYKLILALGAAMMCLAACNKDNASNNKVTVNGQTYTNVKAKYDIKGNHFFWLQLVLTEDGKTIASGMLDTPISLGEDLKGRTVTINDDFGYGDRLCLDVMYPGDRVYSAVPANGKQTFKKKDNTHYEIILDAKDENGKDLKVNLVAEYENMQD
ncbi:MAG: hypothetical protein K6A64_04570 [Bacteroidales bacterium]|nr:hypothetical protein [Bacteroidales bacterium]